MGTGLADPGRMPAQPVHRRSIRAVLLLAVASVASSCVDIQERTPETRTTDSSGGAVATASTPAPVRGSFGADSAISLRGASGPEEIVAALRTDTAFSLEVVDSTPASKPTDADLATLRREMMVPVPGVAASALYDSYDEVRGGTRTHEAMDIPAARGTPVVSAANGRVLKLFNSKAGGLMVYATDSTEHFILMYGHLDAYQPGLADGQPLRRGQQIGIVGTTGNAAPAVPHLHFAIARSSDVKQWWKGAPVNPYPLMSP
jgi:murein DD-endopeptidase MepM/ murein hydrolase activator NlpD